MCLQKTRYSCGHTHLQQLPCDNNKKAKHGRSCLSLKPKATAPCRRRYDRNLKESCSKCGKRREGQQHSRELGSRGYDPPTLYSPTPSVPKSMSGQRTYRDKDLVRELNSVYEQATSAWATHNPRPDSYYEPGLNADVANLPDHYELPPAVWNPRGQRPESFYDRGLNADVANLPGHYEAPTSARPPMPSQFQSPTMRPERTPSQYNRSRMPSSPGPMQSLQRRRPPTMPTLVTLPYPSHYALGDSEVSPVSIGGASPRLASPLSSAGDRRFQTLQSLQERYYYSWR
ncbi:hypothetical protein VPNG_00375 [Cytospora leucostoma]|uniref:Uncharacterized protein n=1 Tax=Cytospora leucostoma TaxID=1230097 RepID=A0A423XN60_9PEZI|nr:hypothetical protein VPNG_00375 [Cytospora leucostoma]